MCHMLRDGKCKPRRERKSPGNWRCLLTAVRAWSLTLVANKRLILKHVWWKVGGVLSFGLLDIPGFTFAFSLRSCCTFAVLLFLGKRYLWAGDLPKGILMALDVNYCDHLDFTLWERKATLLFGSMWNGKLKSMRHFRAWILSSHVESLTGKRARALPFDAGSFRQQIQILTFLSNNSMINIKAQCAPLVIRLQLVVKCPATQTSWKRYADHWLPWRIYFHWLSIIQAGSM